MNAWVSLVWAVIAVAALAWTVRRWIQSRKTRKADAESKAEFQRRIQKPS